MGCREGGAWLAGFLYDANEGSGRQRGGGAAFVLHLSLLEGPQRETRGPLQTQVALISLPSLTLMALSALGVWTETGEGRGSQLGPVPLLAFSRACPKKFMLVQDQSEKYCPIFSPPSSLKGSLSSQSVPHPSSLNFPTLSLCIPEVPPCRLPSQ